MYGRPMRKIILSIPLWLLVFSAHSQGADTLAIDRIVWNSEFNKPSYPGLALGIFKDGKIIYSRGYGMANRDDDVPITAQSVFDIASVSKQFTAACIVLLALRDSLSLDDRLSKFFPAFPDYADKITLRHLLHHTSGLRDISSIALLKGYTNRDTYTDAEVMDWLVHQQGIDSMPGSEYLYCSSGYWLLGQIVNKVSGRNLADFAQHELFDPLGMTQTHFHNDHRREVKNQARGYSPGDDSEGFKIRESDTELIGMGGVYTSVEDMKKWDDVFFDSNRFGKDFLRLMTSQEF